MVKLAQALKAFQKVNILVIGDMLLDAYTIGKVKRISPEAPVAVVNVQKEEQRAGGAGNVILNLISLGAKVCALGRVGQDWAGTTLIELLKQEGVDTSYIQAQEGYKTPIKNRVIAENQQVVRIDHEEMLPLSLALEEQIITHLLPNLEEFQIIAVSDYGKGFLTPKLLQAIIQQSKDKGIPVIVDPKGQDFTKYRGATLIKPNLGEAYLASKLSDVKGLEEVAEAIFQQTHAQVLMITRSEHGISLFDEKGNRDDFPVNIKEVKDVTGAGDTVLAMLTYAIANGLSYQEAAQLCNLAAGIAIEHVGCARVSIGDIAQRLFEETKGIKLLSRENVFIAKEDLGQSSFHLLILSHALHLTHTLFQTLKALSQEKGKLVLYVHGEEEQNVLVEILASLKEVSYLILDLEALKEICENLSADAISCFDPESEKIKEMCLSMLSVS